MHLYDNHAVLEISTTYVTQNLGQLYLPLLQHSITLLQLTTDVIPQHESQSGTQFFLI